MSIILIRPLRPMIWRLLLEVCQCQSYRALEPHHADLAANLVLQTVPRLDCALMLLIVNVCCTTVSGGNRWSSLSGSASSQLQTDVGVQFNL